MQQIKQQLPALSLPGVRGFKSWNLSKKRSRIEPVQINCSRFQLYSVCQTVVREITFTVFAMRSRCSSLWRTMRVVGPEMLMAA